MTNRLIFALFFMFSVVCHVSSSSAQTLAVSPAEAVAGAPVTVTITGAPGQHWALAGSTRATGLVYAGVPLGLGADVTIIAAGDLNGSGQVSFPYLPPLGSGIDVYYLMAVTSPSPAFVPPSPSPTVAVRTRGIYTSSPSFPEGLSAGNQRVRDVAAPSAPSDATPKAYVDALAGAVDAGSRAYADAVAGAVAGSVARIGAPTTQAATTTVPLVNLEQRGAGDLLNLRLNSTTFPGYVSTNPNGTVFRVLPDGAFVARGTHDQGVIPATGPGTRFMWYPKKGAFRAGQVVGTEWDDVNIKEYSFAFGNKVIASGYGAFAAGDTVTASGTAAAAFGSANTVIGTVGFATGSGNTVTGFAGVALGYTNRAEGQGTVALGYRVAACGDYDVVLGYRASTASAPTNDAPCAGTRFKGSFVFSDASDSSSTVLTTPASDNQMTMRFAGGYRIFSNSNFTAGVQLLPSSNSWAIISDRNAKFDIEPLDADDTLARLMRVPIQSFYYKDGDGLRYVGPIAQDFHAAFGLGADDKTIRMNDLDGVALASIQALARRVQELEAENAALRAERATVDARLRAIEERLTTDTRKQ